jgi:hypothetical protein
VLGPQRDGIILIVREPRGPQIELIFRASGTEPLIKAYFSRVKGVTANSEEEFNNLKAQCRVLRAWFYIRLLDAFRNVPFAVRCF